MTAAPPLAASAAETSDDDPYLHIPTLPSIPVVPSLRGNRIGGGDEAGPGQDDAAGPVPVPVPDADIYHGYGTVTPGGGRAQRPGLYGGDPNGGMVIGPGGVGRPFPNANKNATAPKPKVPTAEEKQAQIRKALAPKPPLAQARRRTLDDLYAKLAASKDEDEAKGLASLIAAIWTRSGSDTADLLMARADKAVEAKNYTLAIEVLDRLVILQPKWAEAWNKRAAARFLADDLDGAMLDVDHVLKLEPNHFAALNGMAIILQRSGLDKRALEIYRREMAVYPHQPEVEKIVEKLSLSVEGQGI